MLATIQIHTYSECSLHDASHAAFAQILRAAALVIFKTKILIINYYTNHQSSLFNAVFSISLAKGIARNGTAMQNEGENKPLMENFGTIRSEFIDFGASISIADVWLSFPIESWLMSEQKIEENKNWRFDWRRCNRSRNNKDREWDKPGQRGLRVSWKGRGWSKVVPLRIFYVRNNKSAPKMNGTVTVGRKWRPPVKRCSVVYPCV